MNKALFLIVIAISSITSLYSQQIKEYYITCNPTEFQFIYDNFKEDIYIPATFEYNGKKWTDCRIRIKGDGTRIHPKKSLKVKFDGEPFVNGRSTINLSAEYDDVTYMHEYIAWRLFSAIGFPCASVEHSRLFINGQYRGLHLQIENMDEEFLSGWNYSVRGNLYKATIDGSSLASLNELIKWEVDSALWEKKTNVGQDWNDLRELITNLSDIRVSDFYNFAQKTFDYDRLVSLFAMNMLLGSRSTYHHNYYIFHDSLGSGKWILLPIDNDKLFYHAGLDFPYNFSPDVWFPDNTVFKKSLMNDTVFNDIKLRVDSLTQKYFNKEYLYPIMDSLRKVLEESVKSDTMDRIVEFDLWDKIINVDKEFIEKRYDKLKKQFLELPPTFMVEPINNVITSAPTFKWHPCISNRNAPITYKLFIDTKPWYEEGKSILIDSLTDTTYTYNGTFKEGQKYYWNITANDGYFETIGFNRLNIFYYKKPSAIPCEISNEFILSKEKSPYVANCNIKVNKGGRLVFSPGAELRMPNRSEIMVEGDIVFNGTTNEPSVLTTDIGANNWELKIFLDGGKLDIKNHLFNSGTVYINGGSLDIENIKMKHKIPEGEPIAPELLKLDHCYANITLSDFSIKDNTAFYNHGQGVFYGYSDGVISQCNFYSIPDAIAFSHTKDAIVSENKIYNSPDDAIDINDCNNIKVVNNRIYNSKDKGISVGTSTEELCNSMYISNNVIRDCFVGIAIVNVENSVFKNNTLYNNDNAIHYPLRPKNTDNPIVIMNNVFSQSSFENFVLEQKVDYPEIKYNVIDKHKLHGENCIFGDPLFVSVEQNDFHLQSASPCINSGNPESPNDPDGTVADIGAFYFNTANYDIVINEINYNSAEDFDTEDWVEFYNPTNEKVYLEGWVFSDSNENSFIFPDDSYIDSNGYLVLCRDLKKFNFFHKNIKNLNGGMDFGFSGSGDILKLKNTVGNLIDSVSYDDKEPWSPEADGQGSTLELLSPELDNTLPKSWEAFGGHGTPGKRNISSIDDTSNKNEISFYPNPFKEKINFIFKNKNHDFLNIDIYDSRGILVFNMNDKGIPAGDYQFTWEPLGLSAGAYFVKITSGLKVEITKIIFTGY